MAAHRYWRLSVTAVGSGTQIAVTQLRFFGSSSPTSEVAATGGTASASNVNSSPTYDADKAFDGNGTTYWMTAGSQVPGWLKYDFGAGNEKTITAMTLWGGATGSPTKAPKDFKLQYSDDDSAWTDVVTVTGETRWTGYNTLLYGVDTVGQLLGSLFSSDVIFGGAGGIQGTVTEQFAPGQYRVRLHEQPGGQLIRETWSDPVTGAYGFDDLSPAFAFYVIAFDHTNPLQTPAIQDRVIPS